MGWRDDEIVGLKRYELDIDCDDLGIADSHL